MTARTDDLPKGQPTVVHPSAALQGSAAPGTVAHSDVVARAAEFAQLAAAPVEGGPAPLERLMDVSVTVTAELGRVTLPIGSILNLNVNSILELDRSITEPVDLMVQGVRLARGEVVVVGDCFAIRIKEIAQARRRA